VSFRIADLFGGAGGLSEGFRQAGFSIALGSDIDPDACATYAYNFPEAVTIHGDIRRPSVRSRVLSAAAGVQIVVGGPPCQAFSQVRNHDRLIADPRNALYREFVRIVAKLEPIAFVMENVPGLEQMGAKQQVLGDLALKGAYRVCAQMLDAADFGVPQTRKRLVFIGVHQSTGLEPPVVRGTDATRALSLVRKTTQGRVRYEAEEQLADLYRGSFLERLLDPEDESVVTAEQAIGDLFSLRAGDRCSEIEDEALKPAASAYQRAMRQGSRGTTCNADVPRVNADTVLRLSKLPPGGNYRDLPAALCKRYLTGERWGPHNGSGRLGRRHYYAYRRLHPRFWSWTLNTKADSVYHYEEPRALSVREFARLQSFPDRFAFLTDPSRGELEGRIEGGAAHSRYRQAGNAVPPRLARAIASALLEVLTSRQ
jgi:DNA (cytosine-5)-methyltransferase 1